MEKEETISKIKGLVSLAGICLLVLGPLVPAGWGAEGLIRIGIPLPLKGPKAEFGEMHRKSYLMALEEINASGGISYGTYAGHRLDFLFGDTLGKPEKGRTITEKLLSEHGVVMVMGGYSSSVVYSIAGVCEKNKIPFISPSGAADKITERGWRYTFRLNPPASEYGSGLQNFFERVIKPGSMAILFEDTPFGATTARDMKRWCEENGVDVAAFQSYKPWTGDFRPMLKEVGAREPDVIFMVSFLRDAVLLMRQSKELNIRPKLFAGGASGFTVPQFVQRAGEPAEHTVSAALWAPNVRYPGAMEYAKRYKTRYGSAPDYHGAEAYSAAYLCRDVLERTRSLRPRGILRALAGTDMKTVFGPVKFSTYKKYTNQNRLPTLVLQVQQGKFQTIWPPEAATSAFLPLVQGGFE